MPTRSNRLLVFNTTEADALKREDSGAGLPRNAAAHAFGGAHGRGVTGLLLRPKFHHLCVRWPFTFECRPRSTTTASTLRPS